MKTFLLYFATALAEIVGCYLPWLWLRQGGSAWLLLPAAASLALFAWLLSLHPTAAASALAARFLARKDAQHLLVLGAGVAGLAAILVVLAGDLTLGGIAAAGFAGCPC